MTDETQRARKSMANELIGYLRHHNQEDAVELVREYRDKHATDDS